MNRVVYMTQNILYVGVVIQQQCHKTDHICARATHNVMKSKPRLTTTGGTAFIHYGSITLLNKNKIRN